MLLLWAAIAATMVDLLAAVGIAGILFVPYLAWVTLCQRAELHDLAAECVGADAATA